MEPKYIAKDKWPDFVGGLLGSYEVFGPTKVRDFVAFRRERETVSWSLSHSTVVTAARR